ESENDIEIVGEAGDGEQAISIARLVQPDVVLMDVQMPTMDGLEATSRIAKDASIPSRIVILTTFERDDYVFEALRAGASGFLLKNSPPEELVHSLLATGKSNSELAAHLFVGEGTIKTHVSSVLTKLGLRDRMQAVIFAYESGLIEPGQPRE